MNWRPWFRSKGSAAPGAPRTPGAADPLDLNQGRQFTVTSLLDGLRDVDVTDFRMTSNQYRYVRAGDLLDPDQVTRLRALVGGDSLARRNRDLLTSFLRSTGRLTATQVVLGVSADDRTVYVG